MKFENVAENVVMFKYKTRFEKDFPYYLIKHKNGNFLIGCPEELTEEVSKKINEIGGINFIFISHRDDIGCVSMYKRKYNAKIIIHKSEAKFISDCEVDIPFTSDTLIVENVEAIHTPGHTPGNSCLYFKDYGFLFTGDQICVNEAGEPFVYLIKHGTDNEKISDQEVDEILNSLKEKNFTKIFSLFGMVLENAKERLMTQQIS
ncbi:MBL fold metallo-hydrolase [archaeon]|jgi:glyoxylase-like metal-dependent hydrolase (beta-lactamase superfamily II)|nr:MBL fold metallo-hydrolase [archaeon]MBT6762209.1 MBL fold metallo-hydrolase [archaeon]